MQYAQWKSLEETINGGKTQLEWEVFQFQTEHLKLSSQLNEVLLTNGADQSMAQLGLRFNIFLSRVDIVKNSVTAKLAASSTAYANALLFTDLFVEAASDYLGDDDKAPSFDARRLLNLKKMLEQIGEPLQALVLEANSRYGALTTRHLQSIRHQAMRTGATTGVLALLAVALGMLALQQLRVANRRNADLEAMRLRLATALERAEGANDAKGQFLANMSHEIRTPMNAVLGVLQLLKTTDLTNRQADYVNKAQGASRTLLGLINDVLDFSKIEAGKMALDLRSFRLEQMLQDLSVVLQAGVNGKPIDLRFEVDPDVPTTMQGDDMRLQQILINLGSNAIKFTSYGEVVLRVRVVERTSDAARLEFSMRDTGLGIAREHQSQIFAGFTQAEASTTRRFGGTGLGLAISSRLVSLMGGELKLNSQLGQGSLFYFEIRLPVDSIDLVTTNSVNTKESITPKRRRLRNMRILLVEDNEVNQMVASELLSHEGALVTVANNGEMGVQLVTDTLPGFDVVLMDIHMPVMDGISATRVIRNELGLIHLPIIAMTANTMAKDREVSLVAGMNDHVSKPFDLDNLVELLLRQTGYVARETSNTSDDVQQIRTANNQEINLANAKNLLDVHSALARLGGNSDVYRNVLTGFMAVMDATPEKLRDGLNRGELSEVVMTLHTFKGLAATAGAPTLREQVVQLENALNSGLVGADLSPMIDALEQTIKITAEALQSVLMRYPAYG